MKLTDLHDKLSALLEDPARDLYAETIFTLAADYLQANAASLSGPPSNSLLEIPWTIHKSMDDKTQEQWIIETVSHDGRIDGICTIHGTGEFLTPERKAIAEIIASIPTRLKTATLTPACHAPTGEDETTPEHDARAFEILDIARGRLPSDEDCIDDDAIISEGDDNGAYVAAWIWADFTGTELDKNTEDPDEPTA